MFAKLSEFANNMDARAWRAVAISIVMAVVALAILVIGRFYYADQVEAFIEGTLGEARRGHWGLVAAIVVFTLTAYVGAPQIVLIGACVVAFGPELGFWNAWLATIVSGAATYSTGRLASAQTQKRFGGATGGRFTRFMGKNGFLASLIVRFVPDCAIRRRQHGVRRSAREFLGLSVRPRHRRVAQDAHHRLRRRQHHGRAAGRVPRRARDGCPRVALWLLVVIVVRRWLRREQNQVETDEA